MVGIEALAVDLGRRPRSWVVKCIKNAIHARMLVRGVVSRWDGATNVIVSHVERIDIRVPMPTAHDWALSGRSTSGNGIKHLLRDDLVHQCHRPLGGSPRLANCSTSGGSLRTIRASS